MMPAKPFLRFSAIPQQKIDLCRPEIARIHFDERVARFRIHTDFLSALPRPGDRFPYLTKSLLDKFAHRMGFAGGKNIIIWLLLLNNPPHAFHIITGMPPITFGIE